MNPITRRKFLEIPAVSAGACLLLRPHSADAPAHRASLTFGFSLYGMRRLSLDDALEACRRTGYDAVELAVMTDWPADPRRLSMDDRRRLRERLREFKLELPALMENLPLDVDEAGHRTQLDRLKAAAELGHDLCPDRPPLVETIVGGKNGQWEELRGRFAERLRDWAMIAEQVKTVFCIKPHRFGAMNTPVHAVGLVEQVDSPWVKLAYDYSHFQHRDMPVAETLRAMMPHIRFVHVKDTVVENGQARFVLPGDGGVDYVALLEQLKAVGYRGCVCVEVSGMVQNRPDYDPIAAARRSYANLAPAFEKVIERRARANPTD